MAKFCQWTEALGKVDRSVLTGSPVWPLQWPGRGGVAWEGEDVCVAAADSCSCAAETNTAL